MKQKIFPKTALFSVSNKKGLIPFAAFLEKNGTKIIASGGTARVLKKNGIQVKKVSSITKFPEIFGGRVKPSALRYLVEFWDSAILINKRQKIIKLCGLIWWFVTFILFPKFPKTQTQAWKIKLKTSILVVQP